MTAKWYLHAGKELMYLEKGFFFFKFWRKSNWIKAIWSFLRVFIQKMWEDGSYPERISVTYLQKKKKKRILPNWKFA